MAPSLGMLVGTTEGVQDGSELVGMADVGIPEGLEVDGTRVGSPGLYGALVTGLAGLDDGRLEGRLLCGTSVCPGTLVGALIGRCV